MHETRALVPLCAFQTPGKEKGRWLWMKAKALSVAVNTQLDAAPLNFQAKGKLINKVDELDHIYMEIEKRLRLAGALRRAFLNPPIAQSHHNTKFQKNKKQTNVILYPQLRE
jgi:hypothetical protein